MIVQKCSRHPGPKRLIEVDLPIRRISTHARREKAIRHGHISTLHIWWARRPLAACRAVLCAALWPDPADELCPEIFRRRAMTLMQRWADKHLNLVSWESYPRFIRLQRSEDASIDSHMLRTFFCLTSLLTSLTGITLLRLLTWNWRANLRKPHMPP